MLPSGSVLVRCRRGNGGTGARASGCGCSAETVPGARPSESARVGPERPAVRRHRLVRPGRCEGDAGGNVAPMTRMSMGSRFKLPWLEVRRPT